MPQELESLHQRQDGFNPTIVSFSQPTKHYRYLNDANGDWLATRDGKSLFIQGHVDDAAIWDESNGGFKHAQTGMQLSSTSVAIDSSCRLSTDEGFLNAQAEVGDPSVYCVGHGPESLPSKYLETLREKGWVSLTCVLSPSVVDGLQRVGCVDSYAERTPERVSPLVQDPSVTKVTVEPISLWLTREYIGTRDIRLGHPPGVSALTKDDGQREVQGWHTDFPYLWGTGDRVPAQSGDLVLGMQRNVCVSDFTKENGATMFKLGSHSTMSPPPEEWGISTHTYRRGHRAKFGLPYQGPEADLIEAPAGSIVLYDARTWHRAGMNFTENRRGAMIQAIVPGFIVPFMDTSNTYKAFLDSETSKKVSAREHKELDKLMMHKIVGPAGMFVFSIDNELTERARQQSREAAASVY
ncbi:MAG: phytanoyl-CoA dioxygenase family protein [Gammaproteobacteria bacterium]|nr:phytanoyl-CoA dioxygenase family protein [Gammaproteobacteria bacterium]